MDSITQATLGAAVGHLCWHDTLGRKALIAGALLGTLPDLDVVLFPLLDEVQQLYWHRGESHSLWFILLGSVGISWLLRRYGITKHINNGRVAIGVFLILSTHVLIDVFTVYGTQLFAPISRKGFALNNMFIIDPLFTIPLLIGAIGAYFVQHRTIALWINQTGLFVAVLYAAWSVSAQAVADQKFRLALEEQDVKLSRQLTSASPFNTLLWRHIAETSDGFLLGYWSWLGGKDQDIRFQFIPRNAVLVENISSTRSFEAVEWFSDGWWFAVKKDKKTAKVVDLRFTEIPAAAGLSYTQWQWPFAWNFSLVEKDETRLEAVRPEIRDPLKTIKLLTRRIKGQSGWLVPTE